MAVVCGTCGSTSNADDRDFCAQCGSYLRLEDDTESADSAAVSADSAAAGELVQTAMASGVSAFVGATVAWAMGKLTGWRGEKKAADIPEIILPPGVDPPEK